eukprot:3442695-Lingulodinium_polyedra.AAC.1
MELPTAARWSRARRLRSRTRPLVAWTPPSCWAPAGGRRRAGGGGRPFRHGGRHRPLAGLQGWAALRGWC